MTARSPRSILAATVLAASVSVSSAFADTVSPSPQAAHPSAFEGMGWAVGKFPLGVPFREAMAVAAPQQRLVTRQWTAKRTSALKPPIMPHTEYDGSNFGVTNINAVSDRTSVVPSHWHTGSMVKSVTRTVKSSKPELMPTPEDLVEAVKARFGPKPKTDVRTYGLGGMGQRSFKILAYPVRNGQLHNGACFNIDKSFSGPNKSVQEEMKIARSIVSDISRGACEGLFVVMYNEGRSGRVREYRIIARDFLLDAEDFLNDIETKARLLEEYESNLPAVKPEL